MKTPTLAPLALVAMLLASGCDSTSPDDAGLTAAQAQISTGLVTSADVNGVLSVLGASAGSIAYNVSAPCPSGGTLGLSLNGSRTAASGRTDGTWSNAMTFTHCSVGDGKQAVTLNGSLNGTGSASWTVASGSAPKLLSLKADHSGSLSWSMGSSSSSCSFTLSTVVQGSQLRTTGTACGFAVDESRASGF